MKTYIRYENRTRPYATTAVSDLPKKLTLSLLLFAVAAMLLALPSLAPAKSLSQSFEEVSVAEAAELVQAGKDNAHFVVLDIRTTPEFAMGRIPDAILINYYASGFMQKIDELDKDKTYLVYCHSGGRSARAMDLMRSLGFKRVYHMPAGFAGWRRAGLPVEY